MDKTTDVRFKRLLLQRAGYSVTINDQDVEEDQRLVHITKIFQRDYCRDVTGVLSDDDVKLLKRVTRTV